MGALDRHARPTVSCATALLWLSAARSHVSVSSGCISLSIPSGASHHALSSNLALPLRLPLDRCSQRLPLDAAGRGGPWFDLRVWPTWLSTAEPAPKRRRRYTWQCRRAGVAWASLIGSSNILPIAR
ncbi:hypothetical protein IQ07DRAFT_61308 [Pyrenochaeta sp. DS3sAY3a]|nr:hypothetical protein IQ07DRAFT_61308 [Pyrenochaeta sp. DS3sAY3a]